MITPDTAMAHLSSSIGTKTWILMSPYGLDWRWFLEDEKTIWYNNTKLFRQQTEGDWHKLMQRVGNELQKEFVI